MRRSRTLGPQCAATPPVTLALGRLMSAAQEQPLVARPRAIAAWMPDVDPATIAPNQMRVDLTWDDAALADALLVLPDGQTVAPSGSTPVATGVRVQYLLPLVRTPQDVGVVRNQPGRLPEHATLTLPAPTDRQQWLRDGVVATVSAPEWVQRDGQTLIQATWTLTASMPVQLHLGDVTALLATRQPAAVNWIPPALVPEQATSVDVVIGVDVRSGGATINGFGWSTTWRWEPPAR